MTPALPQGTVTFLFTDIEGSTDLVRQLGKEYATLRSEHRRIVRDALARHGGHEIDTAGDGFFVAFEGAADAVAAAVDSQRALAERTVADAGLRVRMGLHSAEPFVHEEGYVGVGVHRAERICSAGHGGQILLSNATAGIIEDLGLEGVRLLDLGEHRLKGMNRAQRLFQVVAEGLASEFPPPRSLDAGGQARVVTLVLSDLVGWWSLLQRLGEDNAAEAARAYHDVAVGAVRAAGGHEIEVVADTVLAVFERPQEALRGARMLRAAIRSEPWIAEADRPAVRIAVHSGWVADVKASHLGTVAFRCASLCTQADPGQILVSHAAEALFEGGGASDLALRDLGERSLPRLDHPVHVFELAD